MAPTLNSVILDKCYLQGASRGEIESLLMRRRLVMSGALFFELMDASVSQRVSCFGKFPSVDNPVALIDNIGVLMRLELAQLSACGRPSENAIEIRFRFNPELLNSTYQIPIEAIETMQSEREDLESDKFRLIDLSGTVASLFPGLLEGTDAQRLQCRNNAENDIADLTWIVGYYGQLRSPDPNAPFPDADLVGPDWAHLRWLQVQLLFSMDLFIRYKGSLQNTLTDRVLVRIEHDVHDAQVLALGILEGALATREKKLMRWFKLLLPDGELIV